MTARTGVRRQMRQVWVAAVLCAVVATLLGTAPSVAAGTARTDLVPDGGRAWFGPTLPYPADTPSAYASRLGFRPSLYTLAVPYPLDDGAVALLADFAVPVAEQQAVLVLDVQPDVRLERLTDADADALATDLARLHRELDLEVLVRFASEMNGSWVRWGQSPTAYVSAFRELAGALRTQDPQGQWSATVWSPVYGAGYPFRDPGAEGALPGVVARNDPRADTSGNGRVDGRDDPYGPYYPGDRWVDWVGLSLFRLGEQVPAGSRSRRADRGRNELAVRGEFRDRLAETFGYPDRRERRAFYERFAFERGRPMLVATGIFYNPEEGGPSELAVKRSWWRQVVASLPRRPWIAGVTWLEVARPEPEARQEVPVDWRVTADPGIAARFAAAIDRSPLLLRPLPEPTVDPRTQPSPLLDAPEEAPRWPWGLAGLVALAAAWRLARRRTPEPAEAAPEPRGRWLGLPMAAAVGSVAVAFLAFFGAPAVRDLDPWLLAGLAGAVLALGGRTLGSRHRRHVATGGETVAARLLLGRAVALHAVGVVLTLVSLLAAAFPGGAERYADAARLLEYPPPWFAVRDVLTLDAAPWPVTLIGLVTLLCLVSAVLLRLLPAAWAWAVLLPTSAVVAVVGATGVGVDVAPWEFVLPTLLWQLPFVVGLAAGVGLPRMVTHPIAGLALAVLLAAQPLAATSVALPDGVATLSLGLLVGMAVLALAAPLRTRRGQGQESQPAGLDRTGSLETTSR
ncbi:glycosyl hydrolase [Nocardioides sp. GCM10027113]|uniref:glycosyl hydrolase n=1 Tax=unclassified Nocardioides TaxID=2615069 RepID=UPI003621D621